MKDNINLPAGAIKGLAGGVLRLIQHNPIDRPRMASRAIPGTAMYNHSLNCLHLATPHTSRFIKSSFV